MHNWTRKVRDQFPHVLAGILILLSFLLTSCSAAPVQDELTQSSPQLTSKPDVRLSPNPTDPPVLPQKLRVTNQSAFAMQSLHVKFPDEMIEFGDVQPGATTDFMIFTRGVYRYAAYQVLVNGKEYRQPVMDWVGEKPMDGEAFTYILDVDPARWTTEGQVIRLVEVK